MRVKALLICLCAVVGLGSCGVVGVFAQNSKTQSAAVKPSVLAHNSKTQSAVAKPSVLALNSKTQSAAVKPRVPAGTLELIRYQAARAKEHASEAGTAASRAERAKADMQGQAEKDRVERMNQGGGVRPDTPPVSAAELAGMRERAAQYAEYMKRVGEAKAAQKEREAEEKSEELQRQADDLERQLTDESYNKHRDIKLNPVGTNLYIRNYSQIPPTIVPLRAHAANLSGAASSASTSAKVGQASGTVSNLKVSGQGKNSILRKTDVRGEVLPK